MRESHQLVWLPKEPGSHYGRVCVRYSYVQDSQPERVTLYWPASEVGFDEHAFTVFPELRDGGAPDLRDCGAGVYDLYRGYGNHATARLLNGGQTQAIKIDKEPITPPRVRKGTETRYHRGGWQKYTKREGWVYA